MGRRALSDKPDAVRKRRQRRSGLVSFSVWLPRGTTLAALYRSGVLAPRDANDKARRNSALARWVLSALQNVQRDIEIRVDESTPPSSSSCST